MKRYAFFDELGTGKYSIFEIAAMTNEELAEAIRNEPDGDPWLLGDLVWRAFGEDAAPFEVWDPICFEAAEKLGVDILGESNEE